MNVRAKLGIALKVVGCGLLHGRGRHLFTGPVVELYPGGYRAACQSCGMYQTVDAQGRALASHR